MQFFKTRESETVVKSSNLAISETAKSFHIQLREIADLSLLLPDDFAIIREYLRRRGGMSKSPDSTFFKTHPTGSIYY